MKNPLSLEAFLDWVKRKNGMYEYNATTDCAYFHYLKEIGLPVKFVAGWFWVDTDRRQHLMPPALVSALIPGDGFVHRDLYENLAKRVEAAVAESRQAKPADRQAA